MSNYPASVDNASVFLNPVDRFSNKILQTTLAALCLSTDGTIQLSASVSSLGGPATWGLVKIENEEIIYESSSGVNLLTCHRGANGTTAIGHAISTVVTWPMSALFLTALQACIVAIQTALGVTGAFNFTTIEGLAVSQTLTDASTKLISPSVPVDGQTLTMIVVQDATGGRQITWTADFQGTVVDINVTASTSSIFQFVGKSSKWVLTSYRTGVTL